MKELIQQLNRARDAYYNENDPIMSDYEYDQLYDKLSKLEQETGRIYANSPTQSVGYEVKSKLQKAEHNHPMLSLDKTKSVTDLVDFLNGRLGIMMLKMDGLTISLRYLDGKLFSAETRGNGQIGEDVLHTVKTFTNLPLQINHKDELIVDGEAIIPIDTFEMINSALPDNEKYKNTRNLCSGSVRQLNSKIAADRGIKFIAWKAVKGLEGNSFIVNLNALQKLGFEVVPYKAIDSCVMDDCISELKEEAESNHYPIDGMVVGFDDIAYGESLGMTDHHLRSQIAYKFYDEEVETILKDIEWTMGKTGVLTPTAVFEAIEIDGTTVERASLHNVSVLKDLCLSIGDTITVYKANAIIPQIRDNLTKKESTYLPPSTCPICGGKTQIIKDNNSEVLMCSNPGCKGKLLGRISHFVSKNAMNIDGMSDQTIQKFMDLGWLDKLPDVYELDLHFNELVKMDGFGERSVAKLAASIESSKDVNLENLINALSIPGIGRSQAKELTKVFGTWEDFEDAGKGAYDFTSLNGFGEVADSNIKKWFKTVYVDENIPGLINNLRIKKSNLEEDNILSGQVFVITGSLKYFNNREELMDDIAKHGGRITSSVSKTTSYLINNDKNSNSSKNQKAKALNVKIISEEDYFKLVKC